MKTRRNAKASADSELHMRFQNYMCCSGTACVILLCRSAKSHMPFCTELDVPLLLLLSLIIIVIDYTLQLPSMYITLNSFCSNLQLIFNSSSSTQSIHLINPK